jgi:hypothetical protein
MIKPFLLTALLSLQLVLSFGQNESSKHTDGGLIFLFGPAVTYQYGNPNNDFSYTSTRVSWQLDAQLGFISTGHGSHKGNMLLVFSNAGSTKPEMLKEMLKATKYSETAINETKGFNEFFGLEVGFVLLKFIRFSGGYGQQYFTNSQEERQSISYYSLTTGLNFDFGAVALSTNASFFNGRDLDQINTRLNAGFLVKF